MSKSKKAPRALPLNPSLENLQKQARKLQKQVRAGAREALTRVRAHHPRLTAGGKLDLERFSLSNAQLVVAREYGFLSYPKLKTHVERIARDADRKPALADADTFPLVQLPGFVLFPDGQAVISAATVGAALAAQKVRSLVFCVMQRDPAMSDTQRPNLYGVGTLAEVERVNTGSNAALGADVMLRGMGRARLERMVEGEDCLRAVVAALDSLVWSKASADHACDRLYERLAHLARGKGSVSKQELMRLRQSRELPALIGVAARQCDPEAQQALLELSDPHTLVQRLCALLDWLVGQQRPEPWGDGYFGDEGLERKHEAACVAVLYAAGHPYLLGRRYPLAAPKTSLGRDAGNQVVLPSDAVSRVHACIEREGDDYVLVDQESTNGTFVNELPDPVERHVLADGDRFALGATVLIFLSGGGLRAKYRAAVGIHDHRPDPG